MEKKDERQKSTKQKPIDVDECRTSKSHDPRREFGYEIGYLSYLPMTRKSLKIKEIVDG